MFGLIFYVLTMCTVAAALVMLVLVWRFEKEENAAFCKDLFCILLGVVLTITSYYISDFNLFLGGEGYYGPLLRAIDLIATLMMTGGWIHMVFSVRNAGNRKTGNIVQIILAVLFVLGGVVYTGFVDDDYEIFKYDGLVLTVQHMLTIGVTAILIYTVVILYRNKAIWTEDMAEHKAILYGILSVMIIILYNGIMSLLVFCGHFDYDAWIGIMDFNSWMLLLVSVAAGNLSLHMLRKLFEKREAASEELRMYKIGGTEESPETYQERNEVADSFGLTAREKEIAVLLYQKMSYDMIAENLYISKYTVKRHVHNIYEKMEVCKRDDFIKKLDEK